MKLFTRQRSLVSVARGPREAPRSSSLPPRSKRGTVASSAAPSPSSSSSSSPSPDLDAPPPPALRLPGADEDPGAHARNAAAISHYVRRFLDEEWRLELEDHGRLGAAAAAAYRRVVAESAPAPAGGSSSPLRQLDVGDVLLAVAADLSARPELFAETFTDAFETANKVAELLVHGISGGKTECGCVAESSVELMNEAFEIAEKAAREEETG